MGEGDDGTARGGGVMLAVKVDEGSDSTWDESDGGGAVIVSRGVDESDGEAGAELLR